MITFQQVLPGTGGFDFSVIFHKYVMCASFMYLIPGSLTIFLKILAILALCPMQDFIGIVERDELADISRFL